MTKLESLPESARDQVHRAAAKSEFAKYVEEARDTLARMLTQELSIRESISASRNAIEESRILLRQTDKAQ